MRMNLLVRMMLRRDRVRVMMLLSTMRRKGRRWVLSTTMPARGKMARRGRIRMLVKYRGRKQRGMRKKQEGCYSLKRVQRRAREYKRSLPRLVSSSRLHPRRPNQPETPPTHLAFSPPHVISQKPTHGLDYAKADDDGRSGWISSCSRRKRDRVRGQQGQLGGTRAKGQGWMLLSPRGGCLWVWCKKYVFFLLLYIALWGFSRTERLRKGTRYLRFPAPLPSSLDLPCSLDLVCTIMILRASLMYVFVPNIIPNRPAWFFHACLPLS